MKQSQHSFSKIINYFLLLMPIMTIFFMIPFQLFYNQVDQWNYDKSIPLSYPWIGLAVFIILSFGLFLGFAKKTQTLEKITYFLYSVGFYILLADTFAPFKDDMNGIEILRTTAIEALIIIALVIMALYLPRSSKMLIGTMTTVCIVAVSIYYMGLVIDTKAPTEQPYHVKTTVNQGRTIEGNVYHFVMDELQSDAFFEYLSKESDAFKDFDGFTLYPKNVSNYMLTAPSFTSFMTGTCYHGGDYNEWRNSYQKYGLLKDLYDKGYAIHMYTPWMGWFKSRFTVEHRPVFSFMTDKVLLQSTLSKDFLKICTMRSMPYLLARPYGKMWDALRTKNDLPESQEKGLLAYSSVVMLRELIAMEKNRKTDGQYVYIHPLLPHYPHVLNDKFQYDPTLHGDQGYYSQTVCALNLVRAYLNELKRLGRYDKATIIFQSDHGDFTGVYYGGSWKFSAKQKKVNPKQVVLKNKYMWTPDQVKTRIHSLLMIKPSQSHGKLVVSNELSQLKDLYPTVVDLLDLKASNPHCEGYSLLQGKLPRRNTEFYFYLPEPLKPNQIVSITLTDQTDLRKAKLMIGNTMRLSKTQQESE